MGHIVSYVENIFIYLPLSVKYEKEILLLYCWKKGFDSVVAMTYFYILFIYVVT